MSRSLLVDTSSLTYRAFFSVPTSVTGEDGRPVNAVRGYLDMVGFLLAEHRYDRVLHCWDDDWRPAGRVAAYEGYKAQRVDEPDDLPWQFELLRKVLAALGETVVEAPGWEADDAIGTLAGAVDGDDRVDILTGDRDLIQLVRDPHVRVLFTLQGTKKLAVFDEAGVQAKYGLPPSRYVDFAILRGDPSDGLPGLKGVGEKTARDLVRRYPDLRALLADAGRQTPRLAQTLRASADYVEAMLQVVPVRVDADLRWIHGDADPDHLAGLVAAHRLSGPVERYQQALAGSGA